METFGMLCNRFFLALLLLIFSPLLANALQVNDGGTWKTPSEIKVNDNGAWKVVQQIHVNESGSWTLAYSVTMPGTGKTLTFSWDMDRTYHMGPEFSSRTFSTAYAIGDRIGASSYNGLHAVATVAGTTNSNPDLLPLPKAMHLKHGGVVVDNGDGTVNIPYMFSGSLGTGTTHIVGTTNYDGAYNVVAETYGFVKITHAYVPETIFSGFAAKGGITAVDGTVTWQLKDYANDITGYKLYYNDQLLCSATGKTAATLTCNDITPAEPAYFYMTYMHAVDGESLPSNKIWAAGYPDWQASTSYALGGKVNSDLSPSTPMKAITAGVSGATKPLWPVYKDISRSINLTGSTSQSVGTAIDTGSGTVGIPCPSHGFIAGDVVGLQGTVNYSGGYVLGTQTNPDVVVISHAYVAETFEFDTRGQLGKLVRNGRKLNGSAINNGNGTVNIPCLAHGFVAGDTVNIRGTNNYFNTYTLAAQADPNAITITAPYVAETFVEIGSYASKESDDYSKIIPTSGSYITSTGHAIANSSAININGTTNYNGLANGWMINANTLFIPHAYVAETLNSTATVYKAPVVDNGNGTINIPCPSHGFISGDVVTIKGAAPWDGTYTLSTQANPNAVTITGTYEAKDVSGSVIKKKVTDGTVLWELTNE